MFWMPCYTWGLLPLWLESWLSPFCPLASSISTTLWQAPSFFELPWPLSLTFQTSSVTCFCQYHQWRRGLQLRVENGFQKRKRLSLASLLKRQYFRYYKKGWIWNLECVGWKLSLLWLKIFTKYAVTLCSLCMIKHLPFRTLLAFTRFLWGFYLNEWLIYSLPWFFSLF